MKKRTFCEHGLYRSKCHDCENKYRAALRLTKLEHVRKLERDRYYKKKRGEKFERIMAGESGSAYDRPAVIDWDNCGWPLPLWLQSFRDRTQH